MSWGWETFTLILLAKFHCDTINPRKQTLLFGSELVKINLSDMNTFGLCLFELIVFGSFKS